MTLLGRPLPPRAFVPRAFAPRAFAPRAFAPRALPAPLPAGGVARATSGVANATLSERRAAGASAALFVVELDAPLAGYRSGQYVAIGLPLEGAIVRRPYSLVSGGADRRRIELFIRRVDGGSLSPRLWQVAVGGRLHVGPPRGMFVFDAADRRPRLFVGAGTGVAPLLAMLEESATRADGVSSTLVHGVSFADELVFDGRLGLWRANGLPLDYRPTVSRPADERCAGWRGACGRADAQLGAIVQQPEFDALATVAYICGNPTMVDACTSILAGAGMPAPAMRVERF